MPNHRSPTIIVLYDGDRLHWRTQLLALKANDALNQIKLINIRDAQFSAHAWGFAPESLAMTLHVRDLAGYWHMALDALRLLQRAVGLKPLEPKHRLGLRNRDLPSLRFVFDTLSMARINVCSNDDCLLIELNDNNSCA